MLPAERHRKKYLAALPMTLITILVDHTKTPQKFPKRARRATPSPQPYLEGRTPHGSTRTVLVRPYLGYARHSALRKFRHAVIIYPSGLPFSFHSS